jgi:hypothetical protein
VQRAECFRFAAFSTNDGAGRVVDLDFAREADRRRQSRLPQPLRLRAPRQPAAPADLQPRAAFQATPAASSVDPLLQERVQQLNKAIDEVRRQLEQLQPLP